MNEKLSSSQMLLLEAQLNKIKPNLYDRLEKLDEINPADAHRAIAVILGFCCESSHIGGIIAGRNAFKRIPLSHFSASLKSIINYSINLNDEWEYIRLLELLHESKSNLIPEFIEFGGQSGNPEVREASADFKFKF